MGNFPILQDALAGLPHTARVMFGGHGVFAPNGGMFAAVVDGDRIALKLPEDADFRAFLAEGGEPWVYDGRTTMRGWAVIPDEMYDDPHALAEWTRRAHATARPKAKKAPAEKAAAKKATAKKPAAKKTSAKKTAAKKAPAKKGGAGRSGGSKAKKPKA